ncbi:phage tail protein [Actinophytocola sp.]|uniref:phage tail protein n=1 Tax=Actinophytocola sp. TaxID=1872138 RepID=UPI002D7E430D|nr:phage tail protein [Actinophytocola sp.]HET9141321.1 phage tail protein [Actinophytocola sp.]
MLNDQSAIGLANRFTVKVTGGPDLGSWQKAEGLDVTWEVADYRAGDAGNARWFAPANTKYTAVKLTRAADSKDSKEVRKWLDSNSFAHKAGSEIRIALQDSSKTDIMEWHLRNVMPKKWAITSMDAGSSSVAIETLELEHEGFLEDDKA